MIIKHTRLLRSAAALFMITLTAGVFSMAEAQLVMVVATRAGSLGENSVGVGAVLTNPLRAEIIVLTGQGRLPCEATHIVLPDQEVLSGSQIFRATMSPGIGNDLGNVIFAPVRQKLLGGRPLPAQSAVLDGGDGGLRVDGSDNGRDMRIVAFEPDAQHPTSARAEHWPATMGRENATPADVTTVRLAVGGHLTIGQAEGVVLAMEGAAKEHPARVILEFTRASQR